MFIIKIETEPTKNYLKHASVLNTDLMRLKRTVPKQGTGKVKKGEAFISRFAGGLSFGFSSKDSNM